MHTYIFDFHRNLVPAHILVSGSHTLLAHDATGTMQLLCETIKFMRLAPRIVCLCCCQWRSMNAERENSGTVSPSGRVKLI